MSVGINGMGRMGRLALRAAMGAIQRAAGDTRAGNRLDIAHVNEIKGGVAATAHLLEFDSIHGRWWTTIKTNGANALIAGGKRIGFSAASSPGEVPWGDFGCDVVLECTGKFLKREQLEAYFARGVKRVIVAAPVNEAGAFNIVVGVNDHLYDPAHILGYEARPLVSADYNNDTRSSIIDALSTMVTDGTQLKVYAWYDNEIGYVCRLMDLANIVIRKGI